MYDLSVGRGGRSSIRSGPITADVSVGAATMNPQDYFNGTLELGGSITLWLNVLALYRAKQVRGVHWGGTAFFTCWGVWNMYYYPALGQWASFYGGLSVAGANATWLALALYYRRRK